MSEQQFANVDAYIADLKGKLQILEAELVRLRKDRREMERFLLDKIKGVTT